MHLKSFQYITPSIKILIIATYGTLMIRQEPSYVLYVHDRSRLPPVVLRRREQGGHLHCLNLQDGGGLAVPSSVGQVFMSLSLGLEGKSGLWVCHLELLGSKTSGYMTSCLNYMSCKHLSATYCVVTVMLPYIWMHFHICDFISPRATIRSPASLQAQCLVQGPAQ